MKNIILSLGLMSLLAAPAFAHDEHMSGACKADVEKFCKGVEPGEGRIIKCLKEHQAELSPTCQAKATEKKEEMKEKMATVKADCKDDVAKFCKGVKEGEGRIMNCLKDKAADLSPKCKEDVANLPPMPGKHHM